MSETVDEQEVILREGVGLKLELTREELSQKATEEGRELGPNDNAVSLLAALQYSQEQEAEYLLRDLATKVLMGNGREGHRAFLVPFCPLCSLCPFCPLCPLFPFVSLCSLCLFCVFCVPCAPLCPLCTLVSSVSPMSLCVLCVPLCPWCPLCPLCPFFSPFLLCPLSSLSLCVPCVPLCPL